MKRAALALCMSLSAGVAHAQTPELVVSAFGVNQEVFQRVLYDPFEEVCGCEVVVDIGNSGERLAKLEARRDDPEVDVAVLADFSALEASRKGLLAPIDRSALANVDKLYDVAKDPLGDGTAIGYTIYATSIVYRTDELPEMRSWKDLWNPDLAGLVALPNITTTQGPLFLFMADKAWGGTTPDLATGIAKTAEIAPDVVTFYERSSQLVQLFQQDEVMAAPMGRFNWSNMQKLGLPIGWLTPEEGQTGGMNVITLVKGARNPELAMQFIDMWLSTPVQTAIAEALVDSPANKEVTLSGEAAEAMTYGADQVASIQLLPPADMLANREAWIESWNTEIAR